MLKRADTREQRLVTRLHLKLWQRIRLAFKFFWKFGDTNENRAGERESSVLVHTPPSCKWTIGQESWPKTMI